MLCILLWRKRKCVITEYKRLQTKKIHVNGVLPDLSFNFLLCDKTSPAAAAVVGSSASTSRGSDKTAQTAVRFAWLFPL